MTFRTRFAPSPTGYLHVGGARTALYCWLQARKTGGVFVLRIEDTDRERSTDEAVEAILQSMAWLGLDADEGPVFQTQRFDRYDEIVTQLVKQGDAYYCYCSREHLDNVRETQIAAKQKPKYNGRCRHRDDVPEGVSPVVRFKNPQTGSVEFDDLVHGHLSFANEELDDLIIRRSDATPTYNLTVVVDDIDMNITDVIRGDDHINNTPRQINLFRALGFEIPRFAHVPMILGEDGARLSKRHGAVGVMEYQKQGFLPEALLNYLIRLGWSYGDQEIFSIEEMIELFDIVDVNRSASAFNNEKLRWLNQQHMMRADPERLVCLLAVELQERGIEIGDGPSLTDVVALYTERVHTLVELADSCTYLYRGFEEFDANAAKKHLRPVALEPLTRLHACLQGLDDWQAASISAEIERVLQEFEIKMPKLAQPLRVAVTGAASSPPIDQTLALAGKTSVLSRIERAMQFMRQRQSA